MALVLDPTAHSPEQLRELYRSFREDLAGTLELVRAPRGRVLDPMSLRTAEELLTEAIALGNAVDPATASPELVAGVVNVQYATLLAAIDLVKSHTEVPKVPGARPPPATPA